MSLCIEAPARLPTLDRRPTGRITVREVQTAFAPVSHQYGPILFLDQAAELSGYTPSTLKKKLSQGEYKDSVSRGKPLRFWRDRFVLDLMVKPPARRSNGDGEEGDHETG